MAQVHALALMTELVDLHALDRFLMSDRAPANSMQISDMDGFLAGIAVGPELIMPGEWLPLIWNGEEPEFASLEEARTIIGIIMGRYNEILDQLNHEPEAYGPVFWKTCEDSLIAADWADGFLDAIKLRPKAWTPIFQSHDNAVLLVPILALCGNEEIRSLLDLKPEAATTLAEGAPDLIPDSVIFIDDFWKQRRSGRPTKGTKIGRNAPCPCGSGKKYKQCCRAG